MVSSYSRILPEERMVIIRQWLRALGDQHFRPLRDLVIAACAKRIPLERKWFRKVGEFLVAKARCFTQRTGSHGPSHGVVLIGESALEGRDQMTAAANIFGETIQ